MKPGRPEGAASGPAFLPEPGGREPGRSLRLSQSGFEFLLRALLCLSLSIPLYAGQEPEAKGPAVAVVLTSTQAVPGMQGTVTLMLTADPGTPVYGIRETLQYPKDKLTYLRARLGISAEMSQADLTVEEEDA